MRFAILAAVTALVAAPVSADGFAKISKRSDFVSLIEGRDLKRFGIKLNVTPGGQISGKAFGTEVVGAWRWQQGYFCRDLYWGSRDLGPNCQVVKVQDGTVRFIADQGRGDYADFALR